MSCRLADTLVDELQSGAAGGQIPESRMVGFQLAAEARLDAAEARSGAADVQLGVAEGQIQTHMAPGIRMADLQLTAEVRSGAADVQMGAAGEQIQTHVAAERRMAKV